MGRPKIAPEEAILRGTYRPDRHGVTRIIPPSTPDPEEERRLDAGYDEVHGEAARAFFKRMREGHEDWSVAAVELLVQAAALKQLITDADAQVRRDGVTVEGAKGGMVRHPAIIVASSARTELRHTLRALRLEDDA